jgi:hypothetical protein
MLGPDRPWTRIDPPRTLVPAGAEATVQVAVSPPLGSSAMTGESPFGVRCSAEVDDDRATVAEGMLAVERASFVIAEVLAQTARGRWSGLYVIAGKTQGTRRRRYVSPPRRQVVDTCRAIPIFTSTTTVTGNGSYTSAPFTPTLVGTYFFVVIYGGDPNNRAVSSACGTANERGRHPGRSHDRDPRLDPGGGGRDHLRRRRAVHRRRPRHLPVRGRLQRRCRQRLGHKRLRCRQRKRDRHSSKADRVAAYRATRVRAQGARLTKGFAPS